MLPMGKRWAFSLLVSLFVLGALVEADNRETKKATLVETRSERRCYGLDCPPWPTAPLVAFCFQVGDAYYTGTDRSWGIRWANKALKLQTLRGQSVDIVVTDKEIKVIDHKVKLRLWVEHNDPRFNLSGCKHG